MRSPGAGREKGVLTGYPPPMPTYKEQLYTGLLEHGWEQIEGDETGIDWWADEHWRVASDAFDPSGTASCVG